jgi:hypothetical protein
MTEHLPKGSDDDPTAPFNQPDLSFCPCCEERELNACVDAIMAWGVPFFSSQTVADGDQIRHDLLDEYGKTCETCRKEQYNDDCRE